jgi:hypothetical protein
VGDFRRGSCGKDSMLNEAHMSEHRRGMALRVLIGRMRHEGCGGRAGRAELLTGIDGVSSRPVRRIVLRGGLGRGRVCSLQRSCRLRPILVSMRP